MSHSFGASIIIVFSVNIYTQDDQVPMQESCATSGRSLSFCLYTRAGIRDSGHGEPPGGQIFILQQTHEAKKPSKLRFAIHTLSWHAVMRHILGIASQFSVARIGSRSATSRRYNRIAGCACGFASAATCFKFRQPIRECRYMIPGLEGPVKRGMPQIFVYRQTCRVL